jgi:hypothetical protein
MIGHISSEHNIILLPQKEKKGKGKEMLMESCNTKGQFFRMWRLTICVKVIDRYSSHVRREFGFSLFFTIASCSA